MADPGPDPQLPPGDRAPHRRIHPQLPSHRAGAGRCGIGRRKVLRRASARGPHGMMPMMQYGDIASVKPAGMPQEIAAAINLMAHPTGGAAAVGAIGFGVASHAFGVWLGTMSAAVDATRRFFEEAAPATPAPA